MKNLITISICLILVVVVSAQPPDYFNYQAMIRYPDGTPRANEELSVTIDLLKEEVEGPSVYVENHRAITDARGVIQLRIGNSTYFNEIDWEKGPYFLSVTVDGIHMGTSQLLSVPYALYARRAGHVDDDDPDPTNELQTLSLDDGNLQISGGNSIELPDISTPWMLNFPDVYYPHKVGIGVEASSPGTALDIRKNISGLESPILIRLRNTDEGGKGSVGLAMEVYRDIVAKTFFRSELVQTSAEYNLIPDFAGMCAVKAQGSGFSICSQSEQGSIRFYTTTVQDTIVERARFTPEGDLGIGTSAPKAKVHIADGDLLVEDPGRGLILQSPDGSHFRISVDNSGNIQGIPVSIE